MTETSFPNDLDVHTEKSFTTEDNYYRENIGIYLFLLTQK